VRVPRLGPPDREPVAAEFQFQRIAKRRPADEADGHARREAHFQQPNRHAIITGHIGHAAAVAHGDVIEGGVGNGHQRAVTRAG